MIWSEKDKKQIESKGILPKQIDEQISTFERGFPFMEIAKPALIGDGIVKLSEEEIEEKVKKYEAHCQNKKIVKFVPASGVASRMFKALFEFHSSTNTENLLKDDSFNSPAYFFAHLKKFAFYDDLKSANNLDKLDASKFKPILTELLTADGLNYGTKPKGLLKFHKYSNETKTPTQEHMVEGALYSSSNNKVYIHLTVSPEHMELFKKHAIESAPSIEKKYGLKIYFDFSVQKPSTDTIAVDKSNKPFRNEDGSILFRPGGHGALIENLNDLDADIIFIKNIDNIVPDRLKAETVRYKKALAGLLLEYQERAFDNMEKMNFNPQPYIGYIAKVEHFIEKHLHIIPPNGYQNFTHEKRFAYVINKLNRPLRVCGMVKNEDEPGGGPFWVVNSDGSTSLQIVESSQIEMGDPIKQEIVKKSSHFNPVDIVCAVKDYKGHKLNLGYFVDKTTGFISEKSKNGKELKAMELPGLWNGAMSDWNTIFVEVPSITFNPVKTINDLLRPEHQPE